MVRDVLAYFLRTRARATLQNLAEWRLDQETAHRTTGEVDAALSWLTEAPHDVLSREGAPSGPPVFRLNDAKLADAERLLVQLSGDSRGATRRPPIAFRVRRAPSTPVTPLMARVGAWIDSTLARYDRQRSTTYGDQLGFARDPEAVQRILSREVAADPADVPTLADDTRNLIAEIASASGSDGDAPLRALVVCLGLSPAEIQVVLLALASEFDAAYHAVFGVLNDDMGRRAVTLGLACAILGDPAEVRRDLERSGGLIRWRLLDGGAALPHADDPLRLDPCLVGWLFGDGDGLTRDPRLSPLIRMEPWRTAAWLCNSGEAAFVETLRRHLLDETAGWTAIDGGDKNGSRPSLEEAVEAGGGRLLRIVLPSAVQGDQSEIDDTIARLARAAALLETTVAIDVDGAGADVLGAGGLARLLAGLDAGAHRLIVVAHDIERIVAALPATPGRLFDSPLPEDEGLAAIYEKAARDAGLVIDPSEAARLAAAFPVPFDVIDNAVRLAALTIKDNGVSASRHYATLFDALRRVGSPDLPRYGTRVTPVFSLDDVVLPPEHRAQMDEIVAHVRYASHVMHRWGFSRRMPYGRGVTALFSGPSGVGKTMCAQALAHALNTEAWIVDLSKILSRYIGDSEQRLDAVFTDAERAGVVLVFDEADALFGKRTETKDAHDRYANVQTSFLLMRLDAFAGGGGLAVLTTNFKTNLDPAFVRRLRFIVDFRRPDAAAREAIWRRSLGASAPIAPDVNFQFLARRLDLTGGAIQQIAIRAAFAAAAAEARAIGMTHIVGAARAELLKMGLVAAEREIAAFEARFRRDADVA